MENLNQIQQFIRTEFPQTDCIVDAVGNKGSMLRLKVNESHLRPGGTVSGPSLMSIADCAIYVAILGELGIIALAVTTNLNINFLKKPANDRDIIAKCRLMKTGQRLVIGEVSLYSEGEEQPVAHAVGTYSIPPKAKAIS